MYTTPRRFTKQLVCTEMTPATVLFTAQLTLRTLVVAHACLKTYQRVQKVYRWVAPPAAALRDSFVYVEIVPREPGDAPGLQEDWIKL